MTIKRILCPTDFSTCSRHALDHAVALAQWYGARIIVLHVDKHLLVPREPILFSGAPAPIYPDRQAAATQLAHFVEPLSGGIVPVQTLIEEGTPARVIVRTAGELRADLIVLGTHGRGGFEHLVLGSVTEKVLRKAPCPALTVPPAVDHPARPIQFRRILCPIDFGSSTKVALDCALSLRREAGARLTVLHVLEPLEDEPPIVPLGVPEYRRLREQQAWEQFRQLFVAEGAVDDVVQMMATGKPYRQIVRVAKEIHADLILMGVGAGGMLGRMFLGSTTNHVVREAACPVLTVRATQAVEREEPDSLVHAAIEP